MPKLLLSGKFRKQASCRLSNYRRYRKHPVAFCERWGHRFSGFRVMLPTTRFTACTLPPMKIQYADMLNRAGSQPIGSRRFDR
jgi:hypothetical protein